MKRKALTVLFLVGAFLFGKKALASPNYIINTSLNTTTQGIVGSQNAGQQIHFAIGSDSDDNRAQFVFNNISVNVATVNTGGNYSISLFNATNGLIQESTIKSVSTTGWNTFEFSPAITISESTLASNTPAYFLVQPYGSYDITLKLVGYYPGKTINSDYNYGYPYYGNFTDENPGISITGHEFKRGTQNSGVFSPITGQLQFAVNSIDPAAQLSIDYPINNGTYHDVATFYGQCPNETVHLKICAVSVGGTETQCSWDDAVCFNNQWLNSDYPLTTKSYYSLKATTTALSKSSFFYISSEFSTSTQGVFNSADNPLLGVNTTTGALPTAGVWGFIVKSINNAVTFRPYSYVPEVIGDFRSALNNPTSTLPVTSLTINTTTAGLGSMDQPFDITFQWITPQMFTSIITLDQWQSIRWLFQLILTIPWIVWFILRLKKFFAI